MLVASVWDQDQRCIPVMRGICFFFTEPPRVSPSISPRVAQVTEEVKDELRGFFRPHNEDLEELLGVPLPDSWKQ